MEVIFVNQSSYWLFLSADSRFLISLCIFIGKSNKKNSLFAKVLCENTAANQLKYNLSHYFVIQKIQNARLGITTAAKVTN